LLIVSAVLCSAAENAPIRVHGRLAFYNGSPCCRIWVVGTKRILGVAELPPEKSLLPEKLSELLQWENLIFGDFTVVPLTKEESGVMRLVRVIRVENTVITGGNLKVIRRIGTPIAEEPNKSPVCQRPEAATAHRKR
jgi:hypothetical protein